MEEAERTNTHGGKQESLQHLVTGDEHKQLVVACALNRGIGGGLDIVLCRQKAG